MKQKKIVSVVVISYNQEKYIKQALDSILCQSIRENIEILVGDDASTDNTPLILNKYELCNPDIFQISYHTKNVGASKNIYELFLKAKGSYIALLEGDDYWTDSNKLERQIQFLESNPAFIGCTHNCLVLDTKRNQTDSQKLEWIHAKQHLTLKESQGFYLAGQTATLVFRNIFINPQFDYSFIYKAHRLISDRTIQAILLAQGDLYRMNETMSVYRYCVNKKAGNVTSKLYVKKITGPYDNFILAMKIENHISNTFHVELNCDYIKIKFLTEAFIKLFRYPSCKTWGILKELLTKSANKRILYITGVPFCLCKILLYKIVYRREN